MNRILILSGGEIDQALLKEILSQYSFARVICADRGILAAMSAGIVPAVMIGDFDSLGEEMLRESEAFYHDRGEVRLIKLPPVKDVTDTEAALDLALAEHPEEIWILGGTGTRIDHVLGCLSLLLKARECGSDAVLWDAHNRIRLIGGDTVIRRSEQFGAYISLVPFGGKAEGVTLEGFYYPLHNADLTFGNSLGISNEIVSEEAKIHITRGLALCIESRD